MKIKTFPTSLKPATTGCSHLKTPAPKIMIKDLRKPTKRTIRIVLKNDTEHLDHYIDKILEDIKIVMKQRRYVGNTKIDISVK